MSASEKKIVQLVIAIYDQDQQVELSGFTSSRETIFATTLAIAIVIVVGTLTVAAGSMLPDRQPAQSGSPILPSLAPPPLQ